MHCKFEVEKVTVATLFLLLNACGGSSRDSSNLNTDYSALQVAAAQNVALQTADDRSLSLLLKNGVRLALRSPIIYSATPTSGAPPTSVHSDTTVQVDGVDEGDSVKYDGRYIYELLTAIPQPSPAPGPYVSTLKITRTDPATAGTQTVARYNFEGAQPARQILYRLKSPDTDATQFVAAIGQFNVYAYGPALPFAILPTGVGRVFLDLLDVTDPTNVSRTWKMQLDGYLRTSRQIGDTLYLITSYAPTLAGLDFSANSPDARQANERVILSTSLQDLLPHVTYGDGTGGVLVGARDCLVPATVSGTDAYREITVITAINLRERRVSDAKCLSVGENGIFVSQDSLYIGGSIATSKTILHKFALQNDRLEYRATGAVDGILTWASSSYFIDEYQGDLRIVTQAADGNDFSNRLSILREAAGNRMSVIATLPNTSHPEPIGKPRETARAVRFAGERGYVVTFRQIDPLYVIDLHVPTDPHIAGELQIPGVAAYLRTLGPDFLLGVGQDAGPNGITNGVKVELFDVRDMRNPLSVGAYRFGRAWSEGQWNPHALTFLTLPGATTRHRLAMHLDVYDTPLPASGYAWTYSGLHLFEVTGLESSTPRLTFKGVLTAEDSSAGTRIYADPIRSVLHDDSVFYIYGDKNISSLWQNVQVR